MKIYNISDMRLFHGTVDSAPLCVSCCNPLPESHLPRCTPQRDGSIGTMFEGASCTVSYHGYERYTMLCPTCHAAILRRDAERAEKGPCFCSRCGQQRDAFSWSSGRKSVTGLCQDCFVGHINGVTNVIKAQPDGPLTTLLAVATGDFVIDSDHPERRPSAATVRRSWRLLSGNTRRIRRQR